ncbi:hypothetical protein VTN77DRAFT_5497 [Rasamsonia byssochlamydoides]|uniref:uncharacterized protein n=1 Tax=Rasamsonia byssochlamydoides TaxID=89139 RepID=UPI0037420547
MLSSAIPPGFLSRKRKILADLSVPDDQYTDLSPKGSVDEGIRELIRDVNALEGLVTTSSCAGRVSVFVEGSKKRKEKNRESRHDSDFRAKKHPAEGNDHDDAVNRVKPEQQQERTFAASGGKGEGHWLYVSHDPLILDKTGKKSFHELFGLLPGDGKPRMQKADGSKQGIRLVRFHFEPMILHIMAATLKHAQPVLSAASSAGFRESGLQSLRCLDFMNDRPDQQMTTVSDAAASPIVAVRSSGLSLESIIGYCEEDPNNDGDDHDSSDEPPVFRSLVTEEYLQMLVALANERFVVNNERVERFRTRLLELCSESLSSPSQTTTTTTAPKHKGKKKPPDWEDAQARRERKRAEGLQMQKEARAQQKMDNLDGQNASKPDDDDTGMGIDF